MADSVIKDCSILVNGRELRANLIPLAMNDFDIILGMDWLASYHATIDCFEKVIFRIPGQSEFYFENGQVYSFLVRLGALEHTPLENTPKEKVKLGDVPVVRKFPEVFPEDLSGLPPDREIEFSIDIIPGNSPISMTPYRMAPAELRELKE